MRAGAGEKDRRSGGGQEYGRRTGVRKEGEVLTYPCVPTEGERQVQDQLVVEPGAREEARGLHPLLVLSTGRSMEGRCPAPLDHRGAPLLRRAGAQEQEQDQGVGGEHAAVSWRLPYCPQTGRAGYKEEPVCRWLLMANVPHSQMSLRQHFLFRCRHQGNTYTQMSLCQREYSQVLFRCRHRLIQALPVCEILLESFLKTNQNIVFFFGYFD